IKVGELAALLTGVAIDRIKNGSDVEIDRVADGFANVKVIRRAAQPNQVAGRATPSPNFDALLQDDIMLRSTGQGIMSKEAFVKEAKSLRSRLQSPVILVTLTGLMRHEAAELLTGRVASFADALPEEWGEAQREGLSPVQSLLVVYSAVSDDPLRRSNA